MRLSPAYCLIFIASFLLGACCDRKEIPRAIERLYSGKASERNEGALALAHCGSAAGAAVGRLGILLYDENVGVQSSAAYALRKIDTPKAREILERAEAAREAKRASR